MSARGTGETNRRVVFHADDFGMNEAVNRGILVAFREGLLTSTSLLANAPSAESACDDWGGLAADCAVGRLKSSESRGHLGDQGAPFDLGIHLNLTQGRPLTGTRFPSRLLDPQGNFPGIGKLFARLNRAKPAEIQAIELELQTQIEWMCDRDLRPTHLNGHQYIELIPQVSTLIPEILKRYSIPTLRVAHEWGLMRNLLFRGDLAGWGLAMVKRHFARSFRHRIRKTKTPFPDQFFGTSHAGRIDEKLVSKFLSLSANARFTEIGVHPGVDPTGSASPTTDPWFDPLARLRPDELKWLCGPHLTRELQTRGLGLGRLSSLAIMTP